MWKYLVIDDFLDKEVYDKLVNNIKDYKLQDNEEIHRKFLTTDPTPQVNWLFAKKNFPRHRPYSQLKKMIHYAVTKENFTHPLHDEAPFKIMSAIIYLHPEKNVGTILRHKEKEIEVEWKPNRLMVFCGLEDITWHYYKTTEARYTYNYFLVNPAEMENKELKKHVID